VRRLSLLCCAAALGGCGLLIDPVQGADAGNPPVGMDAQVERDAGRYDAGPAPECDTDAECDDGAKCNGVETCDFGECRPGTPIVCDDGIGCTVDACDEAAGGCTHTEDDARCPESALECAESYCDVDFGCRRVLIDEACDDGVDCTVDRCSPTGCESQPVDAACAIGQYCQPAGDDTLEPGCRPIPDCVVASDCPGRACNAEPTCELGVCVYTPVSNDPRCASADECVPIGCDAGRCVVGDRVSCPDTDASVCTRPICVRSEGGDVTCATTSRDGESCTPTRPCHSGTCMGNACVETPLCAPSSDPCEMPVCDASGGCGSVRNTCGTNSSCTSADGTCVCDPGWRRCNAMDVDCSCPVTTDAGTAPLDDAGRPDGGVDAGRPDAGGPTVDGGTTTCLLGEDDCDGDGRCECVLDRSRCAAGRCTCLLSCGLFARCCPIGGGIEACVLGTGPCIEPDA